VAEALADALASHWDAADAEYSDARQIDLADGPAVITSPGAHRLSGTLSQGQVTVEVEQRGLVQLVLDGAHVTSEDSSALVVAAADEVALILAPGSDNSLTDAAAYADAGEEPDAALFSKADLTIAGAGALRVTGRAGDAIASKDGLVIAGGEVVVEAADDAVKGRDYLRVAGGRLAIEAGGDGLKATNAEDPGAGYVLLEGGEVTIDAASDCLDAATDALISAGSATLTCGDDAVHGDARLVVEAGEVNVKDCYEGFEAPILVVAGGQIDITARDDGLNAAASSADEDTANLPGDDAARPGRPGDRGRGGGGFGGGARGVQEGVELVISGGRVTISAGFDGIDANGPGAISAGEVTVYAQARGMDGPFDIAEAGPTITGGTVVVYATGGRASAIAAPTGASTQGWTSADVALAAGETAQVTEADGAVVAELAPDRAVVALFYSAPGIAPGADLVVTGPA
jgi:hypothetical protein